MNKLSIFAFGLLAAGLAHAADDLNPAYKEDICQKVIEQVKPKMNNKKLTLKNCLEQANFDVNDSKQFLYVTFSWDGLVEDQSLTCLAKIGKKSNFVNLDDCTLE